MDPLSAICLSVPIAIGISVAGHCVALAVSSFLALHAENLRELTTAITRLGHDLADAHVRVAKIQMGMTKKPKIKPEDEEDAHPWEVWMNHGGRAQPESVQFAVEWALNRLQGIEPDQGSVEKAESIIAQHAPGYAATMRKWIERSVTSGAERE